MNWLRRVSGIPLSPPAAAATEGFNALVPTKNLRVERRAEAPSREAVVQAAFHAGNRNHAADTLSKVDPT